jgi:hypothetical protein
MGFTKMLTSEKKNRRYVTDQQHAISRHLQHIKLTVVQNIYALQFMYGFAKTHKAKAQRIDIYSTMHHNEGLTYIMATYVAYKRKEMFLQNMFVSERLTAHITAIWTLPCVYTLMNI